MRQGDTPYLISPNAMLLHDPDEKRSMITTNYSCRILSWAFARLARVR